MGTKDQSSAQTATTCEAWPTTVQPSHSSHDPSRNRHASQSAASLAVSSCEICGRSPSAADLCVAGIRGQIAAQVWKRHRPAAAKGAHHGAAKEATRRLLLRQRVQPEPCGHATSMAPATKQPTNKAVDMAGYTTHSRTFETMHTPHSATVGEQEARKASSVYWASYAASKKVSVHGCMSDNASGSSVRPSGSCWVDASAGSCWVAFSGGAASEAAARPGIVAPSSSSCAPRSMCVR
jgi:hypothetical protein